MLNPQRIRGWLAAIIACAVIGAGDARSQSAVSESQLETFLGLSTGSGFNSGDLTNLGNGPVTTGSAIMQSITVSGGATLTFDYDFLTNAPPLATSGFNAVDPFAFITVPTLATIADNGYNFNPPMSAAPGTGYLYQTGYQSETITFSAAGTYSLGIGVANVTTDQFGSALLLDNFSFSPNGGILTNGSFGTGDFSGWMTMGQTSVQTTAFGVSPTNGPYQALLQTASVPEPSSIVLMVVGGLGAGFACHRRKARSLPHPR